MDTGIGNFRKEGNRYIMKRQYGFNLVIVSGLAIMTGIGFNSDNKAMMWIFGILAMLCLLSVFTEKMEIDLDEKVMLIKRGLIRPEIRIPFSDITNYEMSRLIYIFIPVNTALNVWYSSSGKEKVAIVAQGFSKSALQRILNDIEEITAPYVTEQV